LKINNKIKNNMILLKSKHDKIIKQLEEKQGRDLINTISLVKSDHMVEKDELKELYTKNNQETSVIYEKEIKSLETQMTELAEIAESKMKELQEKYETELSRVENIIKTYEKYMINFDANLRIAEKNIDEVDSNGYFRSDDEVGAFFKSLKTIRDNLSKFMIDKQQF